MKITGFELIVMIWTIFHFSEGMPHFDFNLCGYMIQGGTCQDTCQFEARHKWGISLCAHNTSHSNKCCIPLDHPLVKAKLAAAAAAAKTTTTTTTTPKTTTTTTTEQTTVITIPTSSPSIQQATCGYSKPRSRVRRLVGGSRAPRGAWAWQVALRMYTGRYICGGVVISDRWVLSTASCLQSYKEDSQFLRVFVGQQTLSYDNQGAMHSKAIQQIILHEDFQDNVTMNITELPTETLTSVEQHFNDIALIELQEPLTFSDTIQPICLPDGDVKTTETNEAAKNAAEDTETAEIAKGAAKDTEADEYDVKSDDIDYKDCWVAGWGEHSDSEERHVQHMKEIRGEVIDNKQCGTYWGTNFTQDVVCFISEGTSGPCKGDSGGGVSCRRSDGRYSLVGVISWGRKDCMHDKHPSVLTNIQSYRHWINTNSQSNTDI